MDMKSLLRWNDHPIDDKSYAIWTLMLHPFAFVNESNVNVP